MLSHVKTVKKLALAPLSRRSPL